MAALLEPRSPLAALRDAFITYSTWRTEMGTVGDPGLGVGVIHAELGEVLAETRPGRINAGQVTVFGSVGLAFQDLTAGWLAYTLARQRGVGRQVDFLA